MNQARAAATPSGEINVKLWKLRRNAYRVGRVLGDVQATERGPRRSWSGRSGSGYGG
jgi:hypothetical protein